MKKSLYSLLFKIGYKIENKSKERRKRLNYLSKYEVKENKELLLKGYEIIHSFESKYQNIQVKDEKKGLIFSFDCISIYIESFEEFFILNEVFYLNGYNFYTSGKVVVVDIGTNIGIASLFFSNLVNVDKIYAYEPVLETYNQAALNFKNNENKVIEFNNFGLGDSDRDDFFYFNKNAKGNTGIRGELSTSFDANLVEKVEVKILKASREIQKIIDENSNTKIVLKMDCEGGEYEIFEDLDKNDLLVKLDIIMLEWHDKGASALEEKLMKNGFDFFSQTLSFNAGMIYAKKRK
jgi:FkbM family methyltransferase